MFINNISDLVVERSEEANDTSTIRVDSDPDYTIINKFEIAFVMACTWHGSIREKATANGAENCKRSHDSDR